METNNKVTEKENKVAKKKFQKQRFKIPVASQHVERSYRLTVSSIGMTPPPNK